MGAATAGVLHGAGKALKGASKYVKNAINKVISKNESALMNIAKKLDDVFAPVKLAQTPDGITVPVKEEISRIQDAVSKIVDDAKAIKNVSEAVNGESKVDINIEEVTPLGSQNPVKVYTDGYAQVNKGKIEIYIGGKIKKPSNYDELKDRIEELTKMQNKDPYKFTKKRIENIVHNYERSKAMLKLIDDAGIEDTAENNEIIAKIVLDSAKEVVPKNTKIKSTINIGNKPVIFDSWWIIDKNGTPYCGTIILIEVK